MTKSELKQAMLTCIATLERLNRRTLCPAELYCALGAEYKGVLEEYLADCKTLFA